MNIFSLKSCVLLLTLDKDLKVTQVKSVQKYELVNYVVYVMLRDKYLEISQDLMYEINRISVYNVYVKSK